MIANFVVRLLDAEHNLIAWGKAQAEPRREFGSRASCPFWPTVPIVCVSERGGRVTTIAIEWTELAIARMNAIGPLDVAAAGQSITVDLIEPIWLVAGMRDVPLPTVTERKAVTIGVPPAQLGAKDPRF